MTAETEEHTEENPQQEATEGTDTGTTPESDRLPDDHPVVKALAKANEEAKQARLKVKEYEDRDKTDQEKASEKLSDLEKNLTTAQADAVRFEIALEKGLTKNQARRLVGSTRDELETDADELLADLGIDGDGEPPPNRRPKERLKPGASNTDDDEPDPDEIANRIISKGRI